MKGRVLKSWKEIANYIGCSVRTVQRMERSCALPVRRVSDSNRGMVFALSDELDLWLSSISKTRGDNGLEVNAAKLYRRPVVLTVDDDEVHRYALNRLLEASGFEVVTATTGFQALREALTAIPDAVLLDINLPDLKGFEVCRRIKAAQKTSLVPVIFHSAVFDDDASIQQARQAGGSAFLTYPIHHQHVVAMIKSCIPPELWPAESSEFNFRPDSSVA